MTGRRSGRDRTATRSARSAAPQRRRIRIVVADHQSIDRGGIVGLLERERDFEVVGEAAGLEETIEQCRALEPDVLATRADDILALSDRGEGNCLVLNPPSRHRMPAELKVTCGLGTDCLQLAAAQGAMGTLRRSADPEELLRAVRAVAEGHAWYDRTTAGGMLANAGEPQRRGATFSPRELEVAALIAEGQSNKEISSSLGISEPTVKKHVGHILEKLGLADRLQAGLFLARHPLVFRQ